jgi:FAD/FMN-containing dehydrogenase
MNHDVSLTVIDRFKQVIGDDHVLLSDDRDFYAHDVLRQREMPLAVLRPASVEELQALVAASSAAGLAIVARGGGASYTDGYLPVSKRSVIIDCGRLTQIIEINEQDMFVTVEAGVTWAALTQALAERGLRTPFFGPFSGLVATVGGSVSQHSISHGSGAYGISAESVVALEVVLASGSLIKTSQAGSSTGHPFYRFYGPDLTGLFTGDCGAFGIKARITLKLIRLLPQADGVSLCFDSFKSLHSAMAEIACAALDDENFALDATLSQGQIARNLTIRGTLSLITGIFRGSSNLFVAIGAILKLARADQKTLSRPGYFAHYIVTGTESAEVKAKCARLRSIGVRHGMQIDNAVPTIVHKMPFAPLFNILGPKGERWVPLHGILPNSKVIDFHQSAEALLARHHSAMERLHVHVGTMFVAVGPGSFLYEFAFYWQDQRTVFHDRLLGRQHVESLPSYPPNPEGAALVQAIYAELLALFHKAGAAHFQVGKVYPLLSDRDPQSVRLMEAIKSALDPAGLMNPTVLGIKPATCPSDEQTPISR